jgi:hypothetical protein
MTTDTAFTRLRSANPVPAPDAVDGDALFDRIVAGAPDQRPARRHRGYRRPAVVLAAGLAVAAALASSAYAIRTWVFGDVVGPTVTQAEYLRAQKLLPLPPGYGWPGYRFQSDSVMNRGAGGGIAVSLDQAAWECYWAGAIRSGDAAAQARARGVLAGLMAHRIVVAPADASENWAPPATTPWPYAVYADDGGYAYKQRLYAAAAAGRPAGIEQSCRANRPDPSWGG